MTCRDFVEFLDRYVAGALPSEQSREFEQHLGVCPDCVSYLDSYRRTVDACSQLRRQPDADVPSDIPDDLVRAILSSLPKQP